MLSDYPFVVLNYDTLKATYAIKSIKECKIRTL